MSSVVPNPSATLAQFAASVRFEDVPAHTITKMQDLMADWLGSVLAGLHARPVVTMRRCVLAMGPSTGPSEVLACGVQSSPWIAAMANAAASHFAEQDDVHNGSVFHPGTVVIPPALAAAQATGASGRALLTACVVGYEVGIRVGAFLGRTHYKVFHTTSTVGPLAAAAAVGHVLGLSAQQMQHALGSAGTQSAGLWAFLKTAADSKQLHAAHAAGAGWLAASLAQEGFTGASDILTDPQGLAAGMSQDAQVAALVDRLGQRWATDETSYKYHASCRHTHPAADALLAVMREHGLRDADLAQVTAHVHQAALDVLGPVVNPVTVHQSKFSMGTVLALAARFGHASLQAFDDHDQAPWVQAFRERVDMVFDPEIDAAYPQRWIGKVTVRTQDGRTLHGRADAPKGDPDNTLTRAEINDKALQLAQYSQGASPAAMQQALERVWALTACKRVDRFFD